MSVLESIFHVVTRLINMTTGSGKLRFYEAVCLDAWRSTLTAGGQNILARQLQRFDYIARDNNGLKTVFYLLKDRSNTSWAENELFYSRGTDMRVFEGDLIGVIGDLELRVRFSVYVHRGRLFSIEFVSEPGTLRKIKEGLCVENSRVLIPVT